MSTTTPQEGLTHLASDNSHERVATGSASDILVDDEELRRQLENLARDNQQLLAALGLSGQTPEPAENGPEALVLENGQLRLRIAELEQQIARDHSAADLAEQQKEFEDILEEKSEVIRSLHQKIQELLEAEAPAPAHAPDRPPLQRDELEELRVQIEADREQLGQDEATLMQQMTQMEMTMSRERAELARQRNELQRLHSDIRHDLEVASRDTALRDRLATFHRRHQEVSGRKSGAAPVETPSSTEAPEGAPSNGTPLPKKSTGLLRRFFG
jgi:hypothetical protein